MRFMAEFMVTMGTERGSYGDIKKSVITAKSRSDAENDARQIAKRNTGFASHPDQGTFTNTVWRFGSLTEMRRMLENRKTKKV